MAELAAMLQPYATGLLGWFAAQAGEFGLIGLQFLLTIVLAGILYAQGEDALSFVQRFVRRLAGERGAAVVVLAGQAIRAVALGVVVTALVQSVMGGIGLAIAGVPFAAVLTAVDVPARGGADRRRAGARLRDRVDVLDRRHRRGPSPCWSGRSWSAASTTSCARS